MTRKFIQECIELNKQLRERFAYLFKMGVYDADSEYHNLYATYHEKITIEVGIQPFVVVDSLIEYATKNNLTIDHIINALSAIGIGVTE